MGLEASKYRDSLVHSFEDNLVPLVFHRVVSNSIGKARRTLAMIP